MKIVKSLKRWRTPMTSKLVRLIEELAFRMKEVEEIEAKE
ncbi:MAG: hypothetical protein M2R45_05385 [Verrucomicrobia subdivision 3 bacterium]|nr:hypothetical protein [Limisphaerales bacterium]MCS1415954.1 hypothetical protein [Limisphaerales bacterium]